MGILGGKTKEIEFADQTWVFADAICSYRHVKLEDGSENWKLRVDTLNGDRHMLIGTEEEVQAVIDKIRSIRE